MILFYLSKKLDLCIILFRNEETNTFVEKVIKRSLVYWLIPYPFVVKLILSN